MERYLKTLIAQDLKEKMVFIGGPRQVGKTTLALSFLGVLPPLRAPFPTTYINWDTWDDKEALSQGKIPSDGDLIILDEIHKYQHWRNLVKGLFDKYRGHKSFLITGSARLDYYSKGGDSLQGRYHYYRLHPLSLGEIDSHYSKHSLNHLIHFGGFPEPFLKGNERHLRRWQRERLKRVIYEDLRDLERVQEISNLEVLVSSLPKRVGSPLSLNSLRENLHVSHETISRWMRILEDLYVGFSVHPFGTEKIRALKKERKFYLWDWTLCQESGPRFENLVASQLLKYCHLREDWEGYPMELRYLRDREGREIDFVVVKDNKPEFAVECKTGHSNQSPHLKYFQERLKNIPFFYQVHCQKDDYLVQPNVRVCPFTTFCKELKLP